MSDRPYESSKPPVSWPLSADPEVRRDVEAALAARRDLGPDYDDHVAAGLAERVEQLAAYRTADLRSDLDRRREDREDASSSRTQTFVLGLVSLGAGIPISAISVVQADVPGLLVAWAGIVGVNLANAWARRRR
jgi:hypothetical protein